jgi:uncharacterized protein YdeI (YjbR/CyaY-like superfamily)
VPSSPPAIHFATPAGFRGWLEAHHASSTELLVVFLKRGSGKPSLTWPESVDEALCFGWIDGVRRRLDAERYTIRFTPRRPGSTWSAVNVRKYAALVRGGRMRPAGRRAYLARTARRSQRYSYEQRAEARLEPEQLRAFRRCREAWAWFEAQPPSYRRIAIYWVASAKRPETRARRFATLLADSGAGLRIGPLRRPAPERRGGTTSRRSPR